MTAAFPTPLTTATPVRAASGLDPARLDPTLLDPTLLDPWLPRIAPGDVAPLNALHRHRRPIEALVAGHSVAIETAARSMGDEGAYAFRLTIGGRPALMRLSAELAQLCARALAIADFSRLDGVPAAILFELSVLRAVKAFEGALRAPIRMVERIEAIESTVGFVPLHLAVRGLPGGPAGIDLFLDRATAPSVAQALDAFAAPNAASAALTVPVRIRAGVVGLSAAELRSLRPGDIVLADGEGLPALDAVIAGRLSASVERVPEGFRFVTGPARAESTGDAPMQQLTEVPRQSAPDENDIDQLLIHVVFELGRLDLPLGEIRRLAPGYVVPLSKAGESAVDLVANGRRMAFGSLVKIGDSLGVRIERLGADDKL